MECAKVPAGVRKVKKKQVKGELDRTKQAEKKKRRLEKALATSAAIRAELEKKKQRKKEEQQRLDEEGAAIAEAVALRVLLEEDTDDPSKAVVKKGYGFNFNHPWDLPSKAILPRAAGFNFNNPWDMPSKAILPRAGRTNYSIGWVSDSYGSGNAWGTGDWTVSSGPFVSDVHRPCFEASTEISAGVVAAQAVSSLRIGEDARVDMFVFDRILRG